MTFDEFATLYREYFHKMMTYSLEEVGSSYYAEKMAELSDAHPGWAEEVEDAELNESQK